MQDLKSNASIGRTFSALARELTLSQVSSIIADNPDLGDYKMTKVLKCSDVKSGCDFEIRGNSEDEVMKKAAEHAKTAHNIQDILPELASKVRSAIRDESQAKGHSSGSN